MSKKTSKTAPANDPQNSQPDRTTEFVTADKLTDFDPNFNPDFAQNQAKKPSPKKEVRTQDPKSPSAGAKISPKKEVRTQDPKSPSAGAKKGTKTPKKPTTKKEVRTRSTLPNHPKRAKEVQEHLETYKLSTQQHDIASAYLSIITLLNDGLRPSEIAAESGVHKNSLQRHLNALKERGQIFRAGYGVWNVMDVAESSKKRSTHSIYVGSPKTPTPPASPLSLTQSQLTRFQQDAVRTHAFTTRWQIPKSLLNWNNEQRVIFLESHSIPFKSLNIAGGGQRIMVLGRKVHLLNNSILVYDKASYFAATALSGKNTAIAKHLSIIKHVERLLHVEFLIRNDHKFRVSRQHHALIHDHIAYLYNEAGEKLEVRDGNGLWLLIDNSKDADGNGLYELEAVRSDTDNRKVQNALQSIKDTGEDFYSVRDLKELQAESIRIQTTMVDHITGIIGNQQSITGNQVAMAANTKSHLGLISNIDTKIQDLGVGIKDMNAGLQTFNSLLEKLFKHLEGDKP